MNGDGPGYLVILLLLAAFILLSLAIVSFGGFLIYLLVEAFT